MFSFGQRTGCLPLNVRAAVKLPASKHTFAERILTEPVLRRMLVLEPERRNQVLPRLAYIAGLRVSDIAALTWHDLQPRTPSRSVKATSQTAVGGTGHQAGTAACCQRD